MKGVWEVWECIELCSAFQYYTTTFSSTEIHANNLNHETQVEDQKLKINLEWFNVLYESEAVSLQSIYVGSVLTETVIIIHHRNVLSSSSTH